MPGLRAGSPARSHCLLIMLTAQLSLGGMVDNTVCSPIHVLVICFTKAIPLLYDVWST